MPDAPIHTLSHPLMSASGQVLLPQEDSLADSTLHFQEQVAALIDKHWQRFQAVASLKTVSGASMSEAQRAGAKRKASSLDMSEKIYLKLMSTRFCRHRPQKNDQFYKVIRQSVADNRPIPIVIGHGPLKNPNNCDSPVVDWAEFFTLSQLTALHQAVQVFYKPGLSYALFLDDARSEKANEVNPALTGNYLESLKQFVWATGLNAMIPTFVSLKDFYEAYGVHSHVAEAERLVQAWEQFPENAAQLADQLAHAKRNLPEAEAQLIALGEAAFEERAKQAAHRYRVYLQAEILSGIWDLPEFIYGRYSEHPGYWQLFTLRKGSVSQPWQGRGCLKLNANGKMEPFIMTRNKASRFETLDWVETGLKLKGFETIEVVTEIADPLTR